MPEQVFVSWSGGKDCCFAGYLAMKEGLTVRYLANTVNEAGQQSRSHGLSADAAISQLLNDPQIHLSMAFLAGDMQFLHNHQILHSRNNFENWPEPERHRHLLRLWLSPKSARLWRCSVPTPAFERSRPSGRLERRRIIRPT